MPKEKPIFQVLAERMGAYRRCVANPEKYGEWESKNVDQIEAIVKQYFPSGSTIDFDASTDEKLVFHTSYHHMNDGEFYDGWTEHRVIVRPSLSVGFLLTIGGPNHNQIKDLIADNFDTALRLIRYDVYK